MVFLITQKEKHVDQFDSIWNQSSFCSTWVWYGQLLVVGIQGFKLDYNLFLVLYYITTSEVWMHQCDHDRCSNMLFFFFQLFSLTTKTDTCASIRRASIQHFGPTRKKAIVKLLKPRNGMRNHRSSLSYVFLFFEEMHSGRINSRKLNEKRTNSSKLQIIIIIHIHFNNTNVSSVSWS